MYDMYECSLVALLPRGSRQTSSNPASSPAPRTEGAANATKGGALASSTTVRTPTAPTCTSYATPASARRCQRKGTAQEHSAVEQMAYV